MNKLMIHYVLATMQIALCSICQAQNQMYGLVPSGADTRVYSIEVNPSFSFQLLGNMNTVKAGSGLDFNPLNDSLICSTGYGTGSGSNLYYIDKSSGQAVLLGSTGYRAIAGLAFDSNGKLFGTASASLVNGDAVTQLIRINSLTGLASEIDTIRLNTNSSILVDGIDGIAFNPSSNILYGMSGYAFDGSPGDVLTIDTTTAVATLLGSVLELGSGNPLTASVAGLSFDASGQLFASMGTNDGRIISIDLTNFTFTYLGRVDTNVSVSDIAIPKSISLPVELSDFNADPSNDKITLRWKTHSETQNYGWEIERYLSGQPKNQPSWKMVGFVSGKVESKTLQSYQFSDKPGSGQFGYRLKQIDLDGHFNYSNVLSVSVSLEKSFELIGNYPNPFNPETTIQFYQKTGGNISLEIFNSLGQVISNPVSNLEFPAGNQSIKVSGVSFPSGIYFYRLTTSFGSVVKPMIVLK